MPETYLKPCQISKTMRHIENHSIVRTVSGIFRDIQQYSAMFRHIQGHQGILRHIQALLRQLSHIQTYSELSITLAYTTVPYSQPWNI